MFLLILVHTNPDGSGGEFTFQYVSINTKIEVEPSREEMIFTFQYVSINTQSLDEGNTKLG